MSNPIQLLKRHKGVWLNKLYDLKTVVVHKHTHEKAKELSKTVNIPMTELFDMAWEHFEKNIEVKS